MDSHNTKAFKCMACCGHRNIRWSTRKAVVNHAMQTHHMPQETAEGEVSYDYVANLAPGSFVWATPDCDTMAFKCLTCCDHKRWKTREAVIQHVQLTHHLSHELASGEVGRDYLSELPLGSFVWAPEPVGPTGPARTGFGFNKGRQTAATAPTQPPASAPNLSSMREDLAHNVKESAASVLKYVPNAVPPMEGNGCKIKSIVWLSRTLAASIDMNPINKAAYFDQEYTKIIQKEPRMTKYILEILQTDEDKWASVRTEFACARETERLIIEKINAMQQQIDGQHEQQQKENSFLRQQIKDLQDQIQAMAAIRR